MTFNAGDIEASLTIDRTAFQQGLAQSRRDAEQFARQRFKIKFETDIDLADTKRKLTEFIAAQSRKVIRLKVEVDVTRARADIARLRAEAEALQGALNDVDRVIRMGGGGSAGGVGNSAGDAADQLNLLLDAAVTLGPALVPLASGLAGLSSSLVGIGANVVLGVGGISRAMKEATPIGLEYAAGLKVAQTGLEQLQDTAAKGLSGGFESAIDKLADKLPAINEFVRRTSPVTGDILSSGAGALLNLFTAAMPLIETAQHAVAGMLDDLEQWSQTSDAAEFFDTLKQDIPVAVDAVGSLATAAADVVAALSPVGHVILEGVTAVTDFVDVLDQIPGLLTTIVTGLVAWRAAALATALANKALGAAGIGAVAAARGGYNAPFSPFGPNGNGTPTGPGRGARFIAGAGRALPWLIAGGIASSSIDQALNGDTRDSGYANINRDNIGGRAAYFGRSVASAFGDIFSGDFSFGGTRKLSSAVDEGDRVRREQHELDMFLKKIGFQQNSNKRSASDLDMLNRTMRVGPLTSQYDVRQRVNDPLGYATSRGRQLYTQNASQNAALMRTQGQQQDPQAIASGNAAITQSLQQRIEAEQKLFDVSKGGREIYEGLSVSSGEYRAKLKELGGDQAATINYFRGQSQALKENKAQLAEVTERGKNYDAFLATTTNKYKFTADQVDLYTRALGLNYRAITDSAASSNLAADALGKVRDKLANGNDAMQGWLSTISQVDPATATLADKANVLEGALTALRGVTLSMAGTNLNAVSAAEAASNAIADNSKSISKNGQLLGQLVKVGDRWIVKQPKLTEGSVAIQAAMAGAADAAVQLAGSIYRNTGSADQASAAYNGLREQFLQTQLQSGLSKKAAEELTNQIYDIPKDASTVVKLLGKNDVAGAISSLTGQLAKFSTIVATALLGVSGASQAGAQVNNVLSSLIAANGIKSQAELDVIINKMTITRSQTLPVRGKPKPTDGGNDGMVAFSYAVGGGTDPEDRRNNHRPLISPASGPGMVRVFAEPETKGEIYAPLADDWRRPRAKQVIEYAVDKFGGDVQWFASGGGSSPSLRTGGGGGGSSASKKAAAKTKADNTKYNNTLDDYLRMLGSDIDSLSGAAGQSVQELTKNLKEIDATIEKLRKKGLADSGDLRKFRSEQRELISLSKQRQTIIKNLDNARQTREGAVSDYYSERDSVRNAALGTFNIATDGNGYGYGILSTLTKKREDLDKFANLRQQAKNLGLDANLIKELTENPATAGANLEAIVKGGRGYVAQLNAQYRPLAAAAAKLGVTQAEDSYRKKINTATADVAKYTKQLSENTRKMNKDVGDIRKELMLLRKDIKAKKRT